MQKETLYIILCYIIWGLMPLFWKQLAAVSPVYILASRITCSFVFCFLALLVKNNFSQIKKVFSNKKEMILLLVAGVFISLNWGLYIIAVNSNRILETSIAYYLSPIFSIFIGVFLYKEKLLKIQWVAVFFAILGVSISVLAYGQFPLMSVLLCLSFVLYSVVKKVVFSNSNTSMVIETLFLLPFSLGYILYTECNNIGALQILSGWELLLIPFAGILTSLPLLLFSTGVKKTPFSVIGIIMFSSPTIAFLIGVFIYREPFTTFHLITFICIWLAVLFFIIGNFFNKKNTAIAVTKEAKN